MSNKNDNIGEEFRSRLAGLRAAESNRAHQFSNSGELRSFLRNRPVQRRTRKIPLSSYLRKVRTYCGVSLQDFAAALNITAAQLENLESNQTLPWTTESAETIANVADTLRLHITAMSHLAHNSLLIAKASGSVSDPASAEKVISTWLAQIISELRKREAIDLIG